MKTFYARPRRIIALFVGVVLFGFWRKSVHTEFDGPFRNQFIRYIDIDELSGNYAVEDIHRAFSILSLAMSPIWASAHMTALTDAASHLGVPLVDAAINYSHAHSRGQE